MIILIMIVLIIGIIILMNCSYSNLRRIDEDGVLYELDYRANYYLLVAKLPFQLISRFGCSAFISHNEEGEVVTYRNYDMPHFDSKHELTGCNIVVHLHPKGKYSSVNVADATWLKYIKGNYYKGSLDTINHPLLYFIPYLCMDGVNEKGLTSSILYLDVKEGEEAVSQSAEGLKTITINEMNRLILDECANCLEAIELAKKYNLHHIIHSDYHLFISDHSGQSIVLEWRYNILKVSYVDACTNFYVGYDDAMDCYYGKELKERFILPKKLEREYHYGYGHGYERFKTITARLDEHIDHNQHEYYTCMSEEEGMNLLETVSQKYNGMMTSYTQYSCVYNNHQRTLLISPQMNYGHWYSFEIPIKK